MGNARYVNTDERQPPRPGLYTVLAHVTEDGDEVVQMASWDGEVWLDDDGGFLDPQVWWLEVDIPPRQV